MHVNVFDFSQMLAKSDKPYIEFQRVPSLSVGIYVLEAGATDPQKPHHEDEVYYVASGQANGGGIFCSRRRLPR
jgi:mannose-6-phosphate isomerase-like protein (cupin superfamily)